MYEDIDKICEDGVITDLAESYISLCREKKVFPNLAGFCRERHYGAGTLARIKKKYPEVYNGLCLIFEDEALNSSLSATILSGYLKRISADSPDGDDAPGQLTITFEHDISKDGV